MPLEVPGTVVEGDTWLEARGRGHRDSQRKLCRNLHLKLASHCGRGTVKLCTECLRHGRDLTYNTYSSEPCKTSDNCTHPTDRQAEALSPVICPDVLELVTSSAFPSSQERIIP